MIKYGRSKAHEKEIESLALVGFKRYVGSLLVTKLMISFSYFNLL